jgi:hypothetical protein
VAEPVRVNQDLVAVESKPSAVKVLRSVDPVAVMRAWLETPDVGMPKKESLVGVRLELDDLNWLDIIMPREEKKLDARCVSREDGKIHSLIVDGGA